MAKIGMLTTNKLYFGDCLDILKDLSCNNKEGFIDLIYIDPPFNSKRNYNILFEDADLKDAKAQKEAFADTWSNVSYKDTIQEVQEIDLDLFTFLKALDNIRVSKSAVAYLATMAIRIYYMHKVLKDTGSFYLHCDPKMSHYLKLVCDLLFKETNFRNEIVWCYRGGGSSKNDFGNRHDIILRYSKSNNYLFNADPIRIPYQAEGIDRTDDAMWGKHKGTDKIYKPHPLGKIPEDWWQMNILNANDPERLGYPTQKPETLLERIVKASSNPDDLVADFFCGCGTTIAAAERLKRSWIGVDISHLAIGLIEKRLKDAYGNKIKSSYEIFGLPQDIASAKELASGTKAGRLKFQEWIIETMIGGVCNPKKTADGGWDGHMTFYKTEKDKETVLIEAKSGNVNVKNLREFVQVVNKQKASMGVFVCFKEQVTKPMQLEAKEQGYYAKEIFGNRYDKIQILTVEDLLEGKNVDMPTSTKGIFKSAQKEGEETKQGKLI